MSSAFCAACGAQLTPGARFCHRCGTPAGSPAPRARGAASVVPWAVAALALVSLIALVVGQRFGARPSAANDAINALFPSILHVFRMMQGGGHPTRTVRRRKEPR